MVKLYGNNESKWCLKAAFFLIFDSGLVDNFTDETCNMGLSNNFLQQQIAPLASPCSSASPQFPDVIEEEMESAFFSSAFSSSPPSATNNGQHVFIHQNVCDPLFEETRKTPLGAGCSLLPSPLLQRVRGLAAHYAAPLEFTHLARIMLQSMRTLVARRVKFFSRLFL